MLIIKQSNPINQAPQAGIASIIVTMIIMLVISLIVVAFASVSQRGQRAALDQQLSSQAFYAAESAINDARAIVAGDVDSIGAAVVKNGCAPDSHYPLSKIPNVNTNPAANVSYTCLLVTPRPDSLIYGKVTGSVVVPITSSGASIDTISISWQSATNDPSSCPSNGDVNSRQLIFTSAANWQCGYGILRLDLVPVVGTLSHDSLLNTTMTAFLVPVNSGSNGKVSYIMANTNNNIYGTNVNQGAETAAKCDITSCNVKITNLSATSYYARFSSIYQDAQNLKIQALDRSGKALALNGGQVVIDATGKAQDILRRVQVRVPLITGKTSLANDALQTNGPACKQFTIVPGSAPAASPGCPLP